MRTLGLLLLAAALAAATLDDLARERQEELYYDSETLPATVRALIAADIPLADYVARYHASDDEILRFNLVLIIDKRLGSGAILGPEREAAIAFLRDCLREANPWIRTEAVYALGNARGAAAVEDIRACLASDSTTVVYHAAIALSLILEQPPELTPEQAAACRSVRAAQLAETANELARRELEAYARRGSF